MKFEFKRQRGQGAFEYILMLAGLMLVVLLILVVLNATGGSTGKQADYNQCQNQIKASAACLNADGTFNTAGNPGGATGEPGTDADSGAGLTACNRIDAAKDWDCGDYVGPQ